MDSTGGASEQRSETRADAVKPLQPKILPKNISKLGLREMGKRLLIEEAAGDLNLRKPEISAWLANVLKQVRSNDSEARSFALSRFRTVLNRLVIIKGQALCAGLAAYVLEQGMLKGVNRILRAAQAEGDFYIFPKISTQEKLEDTEYFAVSKVDICFRLLHVLILDARTARFVLKGIPDLISILEGAYLSSSAVSLVEQSGLVPESAYLERLRDNVRASSLSALSSLSAYSDRALEILSSRKLLLHRILQDCMAKTDFSSRMMDCTLHCFSNLSFACDLSEYLDGIIWVVLRTLAETQNADLVTLAVQLFGVMMKKGQLVNAVVVKLGELRAIAQVEHLVPALLALATSPDLDAVTKLRICLLLALLNKRFETLFEERQSESLTHTQQDKLEKLVRACPSALARREQLRQAFAADESDRSSLETSLNNDTSASLLENTSALKTIGTALNDIPDKIHVSYIPDGDFKAHKRPCRTCSRASCSNVESVSCEFKVCSGCRLAVYCSRGKTF